MWNKYSQGLMDSFMDKKWQQSSVFRDKVVSVENLLLTRTSLLRRIQMQVQINPLSTFFPFICKFAHKTTTYIFTFRQKSLFVKSGLKWIN